MKILIVALERTGSTSLMNVLREEKLLVFNEPFNKEIHTDVEFSSLFDIISKNNIVVKTLVDQVPLGWKFDWLTFIVEFQNYFDTVILLDRIDSITHYRSVVNLHYQQSSKLSEISGFSDWKWEDIPEEFASGYFQGGGMKRFYDRKDKIYKLSSTLNVDITWFENIFGKDRNLSLNEITKWNLPIDLEKINNKLLPINKYTYHIINGKKII